MNFVSESLGFDSVSYDENVQKMREISKDPKLASDDGGVDLLMKLTQVGRRAEYKKNQHESIDDFITRHCPFLSQLTYVI